MLYRIKLNICIDFVRLLRSSFWKNWIFTEIGSKTSFRAFIEFLEIANYKVLKNFHWKIAIEPS